MTDKWLGKIDRAWFGFGGYQDAMIGLGITITGEYGVGDFWGDWGMKRSDGCKWIEEDRISNLGQVVMRVNQLLKDAKVGSVSDLVGVPVEVTSENNCMKSWRILTEVL